MQPLAPCTPTSLHMIMQFTYLPPPAPTPRAHAPDAEQAPRNLPHTQGAQLQLLTNKCNAVNYLPLD